MALSKLTWVLVLSILFLSIAACQEGSSLVGPENTSVSSQNQLDKKSKKEGDYSVSQMITVKSGGKITLKESLKEGPFGKKAKISAEIKFAPGTVTHDQEFTMTLDPETGLISFSPAMTFDKIAPLTISIKGIDYKALKIKKGDKNKLREILKFVYFSETGKEEYVDSKKIWIKKDSFGILQAEIPHFSRYGFTK